MIISLAARRIPGVLAYLSGSIEFSEDGGRGWRRELKSFLQSELGHQVYDPAGDEKKNLNQEEMAHFRDWKITDFNRFRQAVRKIIGFDLDIVEQRADYVICYWEKQTHRGGGTPAELTAAYRRGIPVYLVSELPLAEISGWVLACAERVFGNFDELKQFLSGQARQKTEEGRARMAGLAEQDPVNSSGVRFLGHKRPWE